MSTDAFISWLKHFGKTGQISPVQLGMTRDQLCELFGPPDDRSFGDPSHAPRILKYGQLEFHFDPGADGQLSLIFQDTPDAVVVSIPRRGTA